MTSLGQTGSGTQVQLKPEHHLDGGGASGLLQARDGMGGAFWF